MKNFRIYSKLSLLVFFLCFYSAQVSAQGTTAKFAGKVVDEHQRPIKKVIISTVDKAFGTVTDWGGEFELEVPEMTGELKFEHIGYSTLRYIIDRGVKKGSPRIR